MNFFDMAPSHFLWLVKGSQLGPDFTNLALRYTSDSV